MDDLYRLGGGWSMHRPPRRSASPFLYALVGAVAGGLVALALAPVVLPRLMDPADIARRLGLQDDAAQGPSTAAPVSPPATSPGAVPPGGAGGGTGGTAGAPLPPPAAEDLAVVEVVRRVAPAVVGVVNFQQVTNPFTGTRAVVEAGYGTGVILDARGYIVTNYHVVENAVRLEVVLDGGDRVEAQLVAHDDPFSDLAVLRIDPGGRQLVAATLGDSSQVQVGETVVAIGNPRGLDFFQSVTRGVVSGIRQDLLQQLSSASADSRIFTVIQTDAAINPGNSGGPLVNLRGEVIGINTLKFVGEAVEGMGFAIPSNDVRRITADLIQYGRVIRPALGVQVVSESQARTQYGVERGVLVAQVQPGGAAAEAGIRAGDVIIALDGQPVEGFRDLTRTLSERRVGQRVTVTVLRGNQQLDFDVVLGELSPAR
ncbi:MAG: trypsin-like peptidase domain-containing protein [Thermaerobacter sp.]